MPPQRVISPGSEVEAVEQHGGDGQGDQGEHHQAVGPSTLYTSRGPNTASVSLSSHRD